MDKLRIRGGVPLAGEVRISGAKNAALPIMCAALLSSKRLTLANMPRLMDVRTMARLLGQMGVEVRAEADGRMELEAARLAEPTAPYDLVKTMRAAVLVLGPLLARCGQARVSLPGGCAIGLRPVDQHVKGLQAMGATIAIEHGYMHASAQRLRGARIVMDLVTGRRNRMPIAQLIRRTLRDLEPHARELGCERELEGVKEILARGNGSEQQLRVWNANRDIAEVVEDLAAATEVGAER